MIYFIYVLIMITILSIVAYIERKWDEKLSIKYDKDGRSKEENRKIHGGQLPIRGFAIGCVSFLTYPDHSLSIGVIVWFIIGCFYYWIVFDIIVNLDWLKKPIFYTGITSTIDRKTGWKLGIIFKVIGLSLSILLLILII